MPDVSVANVEVVGTDYLVEIKRPDGSILKILIPVEGSMQWVDDGAALQPDIVYGLNMITDGHYT